MYMEITGVLHLAENGALNKEQQVSRFLLFKNVTAG
jgi:hypothetical protein